MDERKMYRHMYAVLCGAASEAVEELDRGDYDQARERLIYGLESAEDYYIQQWEQLFLGQDLTLEERRERWARQEEAFRAMEEEDE